jgi:hypothetical protein
MRLSFTASRFTKRSLNRRPHYSNPLGGLRGWFRNGILRIELGLSLIEWRTRSA